MDLKAHIQAARRVSSTSVSSPSVTMPSVPEPRAESGLTRRRSGDLPPALSAAVAASTAALTLLCLAT